MELQLEQDKNIYVAGSVCVTMCVTVWMHVCVCVFVGILTCAQYFLFGSPLVQQMMRLVVLGSTCSLHQDSQGCVYVCVHARVWNLCKLN